LAGIERIENKAPSTAGFLELVCGGAEETTDIGGDKGLIRK
jgi:hypothetical protein